MIEEQRKSLAWTGKPHLVCSCDVKSHIHLNSRNSLPQMNHDSFFETEGCEIGILDGNIYEVVEATSKR